MPDPEGAGFLSQLHRNLSSGLEVLDKIPTYFDTVIDQNLWQIFTAGPSIGFGSEPN